MPELIDPICWKMGSQHGERALDKAERERDLDDCYEAFDYGVEQGLEAEQTDTGHADLLLSNRTPIWFYAFIRIR